METSQSLQRATPNNFLIPSMIAIIGVLSITRKEHENKKLELKEELQ